MLQEESVIQEKNLLNDQSVLEYGRQRVMVNDPYDDIDYGNKAAREDDEKLDLLKDIRLKQKID